MKRIAYVHNGTVHICNPAPGNRLVFGEIFPDGEMMFDKPYRLEDITRRATDRQLMGETDDAFFTRIIAKDVPADATDVRVIEATDEQLEKIRDFRGAYTLSFASPIGIDVDMLKARELHRQRLRKLRKPLLAALDVEYQRADEDGDAQRKRDVAEQKRALRNVTDDPMIDAAQTPEELRAAIPAILKG